MATALIEEDDFDLAAQLGNVVPLFEAMLACAAALLFFFAVCCVLARRRRHAVCNGRA